MNTLPGNGTPDSWSSLCTRLSAFLHLTESQTENLTKNPFAKLIYTLPFLAQCFDAQKTALAHIVLYCSEIFFFGSSGIHTPLDDTDNFHRLRFISQFEGGNERVIKHGMALLALGMLGSYERSKESDSVQGIYNPLNSGTWNFEEKKNELEEIIKCNYEQTVADILSVEMSLQEPWESIKENYDK